MTEYKNQIDKFPLSKAVVLPNGFVRFVCPIARVTKPGEKGFLNISQNDSKPYYQRISKEVLERTKDSFLTIPATHKHPPEFVNSINSRQYTRGLTGSSKNSIIQIDSYQFATGTIFDEELIKAIKEQVAREISPGYRVALSPLQNDTCDQVDRRGNHLAFLASGRQGSNVALQLDESEIAWDYASQYQFDEAELADIKQEILALPTGYLDLSYVEQTIDLNMVSDTKKQTDKDEKDMNKLQLVTDQGIVLTLESEQCDQVADYVDRLKKKNDVLAIESASKVSKEQIDQATAKLDALTQENASLKTQQTDGSQQTIVTLEAQIEALKTQQGDRVVTQLDQSAIQDKARELALDFMKVAPSILKLDPAYQFDSVPSLAELQRSFVVLACPAKATEIKALQLDDSQQGQINAAKIAGYFEVLNAPNFTTVAQQQKDSSEDNNFSKALQTILSHGVQQDSQYVAAQKTDTATKTFISEVDSRF
jgi:hypothetical protein